MLTVLTTLTVFVLQRGRYQSCSGRGLLQGVRSRIMGIMGTTHVRTVQHMLALGGEACDVPGLHATRSESESDGGLRHVDK